MEPILQEILEELKKLNRTVLKIENKLNFSQKNTSLSANLEKLKYIDKEVEKIDMFKNGKIEENQLWQHAQGVIKTELTEVSFNTWIKDIKLIEIKEEVVYLKADNDFIRDIIENRYADLLKKALCFYGEKDYKIVVTV